MLIITKICILLISGPHISLWLKPERQKGSHDSINSWLGKKGIFEPNSCRLVQTKANFALVLEGTIWLIFIHTLSSKILGSCPLATSCRRVAKLRGHFDIYNQHFTCAILKIWSPRIEYQEDEWKRKIVNDFMNVNVLTKQDIKATFVGGKLEQWEIKMGETTRLAMIVHFEEESKTLISMSWYPCKSERKTEEKQILEIFNRYETMYNFVQYLSETLKMNTTK